METISRATAGFLLSDGEAGRIDGCPAAARKITKVGERSMRSDRARRPMEPLGKVSLHVPAGMHPSLRHWLASAAADRAVACRKK